MLNIQKVVLMLCVSLAFSPLVSAGMETKIGEARVISLVGSAEYQKAGRGDWSVLTEDVVLYERDVIRTNKDSGIVLELTGNAKTAEVTVRESTEFKLDTFHSYPSEGRDKTLLDVAKGSILIKAEKLQGDSSFEVKTPTTVAGIRGTIFEVNVE